ncbi:RNA-directed DNA polymerase, eukaryota, reverse transcriptase zinc-binding domain protein, partial [Tanacetum coccineum]
MSNLSQKGANSESYMDLDEIRVNDEDNHSTNDELGVGNNGTKLVLSNKECLDKGVKGVERTVRGSKNRSCVTNDESELNVAHGEKENKDNSDKMQVDHKQAYVEDRNKNENRMRNKNNVKSYANATRDNMPQEINKLRNIPISLNELGEEVIIFDEELVKLGSKKWELTLWLFKFNKEDGMLEVATKSPWKVNVWVKLFNMPMEAWTNDGVSAISSCIGKPKIMDSMTAYVCKNGLGTTEYARVLVKIQAVNVTFHIF